MNRISLTFDKLRANGETALIPYIMAGDPSLAVTESLVLALEKGGADLIELGVPFSDPIADGPVIQQAADRALQTGTTLRGILRSVASLRHRTQIPMILMTYYNTIMAMGEESFCHKAVAAGVDGVIVPDMPPEECDTLCAAAEKSGGPVVIFLLAPTSTTARQQDVVKRSHGFIYYVSLTGITGARLRDMTAVQKTVRSIKRATRIPVAVGFGISTPQQAREVARFADGVIVGSAIVKQIHQTRSARRLPGIVEHFACKLKAALR